MYPELTMDPDIPRELQYLITSYNHDAIFSLPLEHLSGLNWSILLRDFFGYEGSSDVSTIDLICLYIDRCQKKKFVFCETDHIYVRIGNTMKVGKSPSWRDLLPYSLPDRVTREIEDIVTDYERMFVKFNNCLMARGRNRYGQLGNGNTMAQMKFIEIKLDKIDQIALGNYHTLILMEDGSVMGSGSNEYGELGFDSSVSNINEFKKIGVDNVKKILCFDHCTFFLLKNGKLLNCGCNLFQSLDDRKFNEINEIADLPGKVIDIAGSDSHNMLLLLANGTLMACGQNTNGQLGFRRF